LPYSRRDARFVFLLVFLVVYKAALREEDFILRLGLLSFFTTTQTNTAMTAADKYYLKAQSSYGYDVDETLEALEYGLSCDDTHPGLLTLQGDLYFYQLKQFEAAQEQYELSLFYDASFVRTYYSYIRLLLTVEELKRAERLIKKAITVRGIDKSRVLHLQAVLFEKQERYADAIENLKKAKEYTQSKESISFYADELQRVEQKNISAEVSKKQVNIVLV